MIEDEDVGPEDRNAMSQYVDNNSNIDEQDFAEMQSKRAKAGRAKEGEDDDDGDGTASEKSDTVI